MKTLPIQLGLFTLILFSILIQACSAQQQTSPQTAGTTPTSESDMQPGPVESSYRTAQSYQQLVSESNVIVIGQVVGAVETVNLARMPNDLTQPDPNVLSLGQVYSVTVQRYLKGAGALTLNIVQEEAFLSERTPKTPENIQKARASYKLVPLRMGIKYLFFLRNLLGFTGKNYFVGTRHPWRFTLPDSGDAEPESPWQYAKQVFPPQSTSGLIQTVSQLANPLATPQGGTPVATPTRKPYP